jgi:hypothetical protein
MLKLLFAATLLALGIGFAGSAQAQGAGGFEICSGEDPKCQTPGTIGLSCLGRPEVLGDLSLWRDSGDALRVQGGRWQMFYAASNQTYNCAQVLVQRGGGWGTGLRICAGDDRSCQGPGVVAYSCFLEGSAVGQPTQYQYTGDAIRVAANRWQIWYSHNQQTYPCAAVLVGTVPYGYGPLRFCTGNDTSCQTPGTVPLLCDIDDERFANPTNYDYTGRSMRVSGGQWQMQYPNQSTYTCRNVIVATATVVPPSTPTTPPMQPTPPGQAALLPSGSVIIYDGFQCPTGWVRIGQVNQPGTPVSGMSFCRRQ